MMMRLRLFDENCKEALDFTVDVSDRAGTIELDELLPIKLRAIVVSEFKAPSAEEIKEMKKVPGGETVWTTDGKREYDPETKKWTKVG